MSGRICDFCNGTEASYALRCDDLALQATGTYGTAVAALSGAWHACDACLPFIERGDPDGLADYVTRAGHGPPQPLGREAVGVGAPNRGQLAATDGC